jgi:hypothetical protein
MPPPHHNPNKLIGSPRVYNDLQGTLEGEQAVKTQPAAGLEVDPLGHGNTIINAN